MDQLSQLYNRPGAVVDFLAHSFRFQHLRLGSRERFHCLIHRRHLYFHILILILHRHFQICHYFGYRLGYHLGY